MWWAYTRGGLYSGGGGLIVGGLRYITIYYHTCQKYIYHMQEDIWYNYTAVYLF
jgi:hypothetical protein